MRRNFPRPYTTTYLRFVVWVNSWPLQIRKLPPSFRLYLRVSLPSLSTPSVSRSLSMPFRLMLSPCFRSSQPRPLAMLHQFLAYSPGLPLRVPRRWRKVRDSNPRCVLPHATLAVWCFQPAQPTFQNKSWYFILLG